MFIIKNGIIQEAREPEEYEEIVYSSEICEAAGLDFKEVTANIIKDLGADDYCELCPLDYIFHIEMFEEPWKKLLSEHPYIENIVSNDRFFEEDT